MIESDGKFEAPGRAPQTPWRAQFGRLARLATPIALSRLAMLLIVIEDIVFLGHVDSLELAHYGIANAVFMVLLLSGVGMSIGVVVLTSQTLGAGEGETAVTVFGVGMAHAVLMGAAAVLLAFAGERIFLAIGHAPELAAGSGRALEVLAFGIPGALIFTVATLFLEAFGRPHAGVVVMIAANLVNIALNVWLLDSGPDLGLDPAEAVALASTIARVAMALAMVVHVLARAARMTIGSFDLNAVLAVSRKLRRIGYAMGLAQGLESLAFASLTIVSGYLGATAVAAFQVIMQFMAFAFMGAVGVATATAVEVGRAVGRGDRLGIRRAGWCGLGVITFYMGAVTLLLVLAPEALTQALTSDREVVALALPALFVVAFMLIPDGAQGVLMGALRGTGDAWVPTVMHLFAFLVVMVPAARLLAIEAGLGVGGLIGGTLLGVSLATVLLAARFWVISGRDVRPL